LAVTRRLAQHYFRASFIEQQPEIMAADEPVIFAANHSGMNFPWDCFVLFEHLRRTQEGRRDIRPISAPMLLNQRLLSPFAIPCTWNYFTAPATMENLEKLVRGGGSVLINPEGVAGIGKGFNRRYELQRFSSSYIRMSLKYGRPIVPVSVVNGEYLNPLAYSFRWINRLANKIGLPFLPVGPTLLLCAIFPFVAYVALPARLRYVFGKAIRPEDLTSKNYEELTETEIRALNLKVKDLMQKHLDESVAEHGRRRFALGPGLLALFPLTWPFLFHRAYLGDKASAWSGFKALATCLALLLPVLGWPALIFAFAFAKKTELVETETVQEAA
jgi:1-acyl-sn-glycerol-3-phosphate acyltransferase